MVSSSHPLASSAALGVLRQGGNAIDAAIAANAVLGVVEPTGAGVGGDLFSIVWCAKSAQLYGFNGSGAAPRSLKLATLREAGSIPSRGPLSVTVPGCVDGWWQLHKRFGHQAWDSLFEPAIEYAQSGFPLSDIIAAEWRKNVETLGDAPGFREVYAPTGKSPKAGEKFSNPGLARTLSRVAEAGWEGFYEGPIAAAIEATVTHQGGWLSACDLKAHRGEWVTPLSTRYRGVEVYELPPNTQGLAALQMLNIIECFDLAAMGWQSADALHVLIEAKKLAFEDRARFYADPAFAEAPIGRLLSKEYAAEQARSIDLCRARTDPTHIDPPQLERGDTVYLTTADCDGNLVSLIQSNYQGMGSGVVPAGWGFNLQNRGSLFSLAAGHANQYAPGKRPFHTIIPGFACRDGHPWLSFGVMGGAMQPQGHVQVLSNMIDFHMNVQEAGDAPRIVHWGSGQPTGESHSGGGWIALERGVEATVQAELESRGHRIQTLLGGHGGYQAIEWNHETGAYAGASEARKDGHSAGF